jgi:hypothetical protein
MSLRLPEQLMDWMQSILQRPDPRLYNLWTRKNQRNPLFLRLHLSPVLYCIKPFLH